jgi:hypothetical protein
LGDCNIITIAPASPTIITHHTITEEGTARDNF